MPKVSSLMLQFSEWVMNTLLTIVKQIRDDNKKYTKEYIDQVFRPALQALLEGQAFKMTFIETIRDLCLSLDPTKIRQGWNRLCRQWQLSLEIPEVPYDTERIKSEKERGRVLIFIPPHLADALALPTLGQLFFWMDLRSTNANSGVVVDPVISGWMFVEDALDTPNLNTTEDQLRETFDKQGATGYGLPVYIIFAQFCKEVYNRYPDPGIDNRNYWSRLLGSSSDNGVMYIRFLPGGGLVVGCGSCFKDASVGLGGRSAAV